jgi:crotonobetainyl-CoA:carnitine CoA-transferase CaiB-like acyl-CoA transferase
MEKSSVAVSPLESVRVLELTTSIAGPYCGLILASLGADVIKVEQPGRGDDTRSWGPPYWHGESATFLAMNAAKRSIAVNLKSDDGRRVVKRIAASADVVLQNLRPTVADSLGLGFDDLATINRRLVYCAIGAFGSPGPRASDPGYDPMMQAAAGIMSVTGEPGRPPVRAGASIVDQGSGMWAVIGILAALRQRDAGEGPQLVDLSLYETAVNLIPYQLLGFLGSGELPRALGSAVAMIAPYEAFATTDGWVVIAAGNDRLFQSLCNALDLPGAAADARFATNPDRVANRAELAALIADRVAPGSTAEIVDLLNRAGVPSAPVQDVGQVLASEQTQALGLVQTVPYPGRSDLQLVAPPIRLNEVRLRHRSGPPALGADTTRVLRQAGLAHAEISQLISSGVVQQG